MADYRGEEGPGTTGLFGSAGLFAPPRGGADDGSVPVAELFVNTESSARSLCVCERVRRRVGWGMTAYIYLYTRVHIDSISEYSEHTAHRGNITYSTVRALALRYSEKCYLAL